MLRKFGDARDTRAAAWAWSPTTLRRCPKGFSRTILTFGGPRCDEPLRRPAHGGAHQKVGDDRDVKAVVDGNVVGTRQSDDVHDLRTTEERRIECRLHVGETRGTRPLR